MLSIFNWGKLLLKPLFTILPKEKLKTMQNSFCNTINCDVLEMLHQRLALHYKKIPVERKFSFKWLNYVKVAVLLKEAVRDILYNFNSLQ